MLWSGDFNPEVVGQLWTRLRVTCSQPFKFNHDSCGLSMLVLQGEHGEQWEGGGGGAAAAAGVEQCGRGGGGPGARRRLENTVRLGEEGRRAGGSLDQAAMSRSAKLVARAAPQTSPSGPEASIPRR